MGKRKNKKDIFPVTDGKQHRLLWYNSIGFKILMYFMIPVFLIIFIGLLSYGQASKIITKKYMESTLEGIKMTSEYIRFGFSGIEAVAFELISNEEVKNYYLGMYSNASATDMESISKSEAIQRLILTKRAANSFIDNIYLLSEQYGMNTTGNKTQNLINDTKNGNKTVIYTEFIKNEGKPLLTNKRTGIWMSQESAMDKLLDIDSSEYGIRYARAFQSSKSCIVIDVSAQAILKVLQQLDFGKECISAFITAEDKEIIYTQDNLPDMTGTLKLSKYINTKFESDENAGSTKVNYNGSRYLFFYSKIGKTGAVICSLIPETSLVEQLDNIRTITFILIVVSSIIAIVIAFQTRRLTKPIQNMMGQMARIENGDFKIELAVESKDEIGILSRRFNQMSKELENYINQSYVAQIKQNEAEMTALKSQIYPHFLYNTLEVIRMTALNEGDERVSNMIDALSSQIHYIIGPMGDMVPLEREVDIVRKYIYLLNCRNNGQMNFIVNLGGYADIMVPKLILQPIVENSYIHGMKPRGGSGNIMLEVERTENCLEIILMDNGVGMEENTLNTLLTFMESNEIGIKNEYNWQSIGLKNVNDRLRYLYGKEYGLLITSAPDVGTMVRIRLPLTGCME